MTVKDVLDANPGLVLQQRTQARQIEARNARALGKMREIVKAAKSGGGAVAGVRVDDCDVADITAYLRDCAAQHTTGKLMGAMSKHPGMIHGS